MALLTTLILIASIIGIFFLFVKWKLTYWKRRGVPYQEPDFFFGNARKQLTGTPLSELIMKNYLFAKSQGYKHYGGFIFTSPVYTPVDLNIIKNIFQKDFNHFVNHGMYVNEEDDPLTGNLFNLEDEKWRNLRVKLTPTFTSGKMKMMFPTLVACTEGLGDILKDHCIIQDPVDIKDVVSRFTTDIIGSCAFGLDCNSLKNPNSEFRRYGKMIFNPPYRFQQLRTILFFVVPRNVLKFFKIKQLHPDIENFFMNMVRSTVEYREKHNIFRKDFLHLLLQLKNKGEVTDDENITKDKGLNNGTTLSMNELAAQSFVFFGAGFETSATTLTFALLELAINRDVQDRLREDIVTELTKHNGQLTYEAMMEMTYLDKVVNDLPNTPPEILIQAEETSLDLLPAKSKKRYEEIYEKFMKWRITNHVNSYSENVLLAYFGNLEKKFKASTLWSIYSMLKTTLSLKNNIDISKYFKLRSLLKRKSDGFKSNKSKIFSSEEINSFLNNAADSKYLITKVALIFGISGACRCHELKDLIVNDVKDTGSTLLIEIRNTKTKIPRSFHISGSLYTISKKYINLRPLNMDQINKFFINYQNGKCTKQVVGINKISKFPMEIAIYLNLTSPQLYTGHCFRRTSATLLVDAGGDLVQLKKHGGWKSSSVAEGYVDQSSSSKNQIQTKILQSVQNSASSSEATLVNKKTDMLSINKEVNCDTPIILNNCSIITINQYLGNK